MRVLLIEDRQKRQEQFLANSSVKLSKFTLLDNKIGLKYQEFKKKVLDDSSILSQYDIIISHRSAFDKDNAKIMDIIEDHCIANSKKLILFSGGIYSSHYQTEPFEKLSLNSKILYSENLELFLDDSKSKEKANLYILAYGENWEINLLLRVLEKINLLLHKDHEYLLDLDFDDLNDETDIEMIQNYIDLENVIEEDSVTKESLSYIRDSIMDLINKKLDLYNA